MVSAIALPCQHQGTASGGEQSGNRIVYRRTFSIAEHFKIVQAAIFRTGPYRTQYARPVKRVVGQYRPGTTLTGLPERSK